MKYLLLVTILYSSAALAADAKSGETLFNNRACVGCHSIGSQGGAMTGPNLAGVTERRKEDWLKRWIKAPDQMQSDPLVKQLKAKYAADMPNVGLTDDEVQSLILFLKTKSAAK
jgi:cytochrome c2